MDPTLAAVGHAVLMAPFRMIGPVLAGAAVLLSACAAGPDTVGPSGVDGLEIPTPTPDPADFVEGIDNPYLPLRPGNEWVYDVMGGEPRTITITVTDETRDVAGVTATVVEEVVTVGDDRVVSEASRWFAQDRAGNVWSFGEAAPTASWEAGVGGAQAGLAMAARPRVGDGYEQEFAAGEAEDRAEVLSLSESLDLATGSYDDLLVTEDTTPLEPSLVVRRYYARGTGLVLVETVPVGSDQLELVSFTRG